MRRLKEKWADLPAIAAERPMQKRVTMVAVVDDDPSMLKAAADLLDARGFSASSFTSAEEFLDSGEAEHVDCLLLDIHLGGLSGIELRQRLSASYPTLPVIFMTATDDDTLRQQALGVGCVACLRKPFPARQLIDALDRAIPH
jgi:FixJ family two-component response regulator